jgi:O-antigen/teichoic acid export membrane protein
MRSNLVKIFTYIFGGFCSQLIILVFWFYVKKEVSLSEIGRYQLGLFFIDIIAIISMLGIDSGYAKLFFNKKKNLDKTVLFLINSAALITFLVFGFFVLLKIILIPFLNIYSQILIMLGVFVQINFNFFMNKLVIMSKSKEYISFQIARSILIVLISAILIKFYQQSSIALFLGQFFGVGLLLLIMLGVTKIQNTKSKILYSDSTEILKYTIPLMLSGIIGVITVYSSRLILSATVTIDQVGALGVYMGFSSPIIAIIAVINKFYYPFVIKKLSNKEDLNKLYPYFFYIVSGYIFLFYMGVLSYYLYFREILFADKLIENSFVFLHLAASSIIIVLYTLYSPVFVFNNTKKLLIANIGSLLIGSVFQYILLLNYGFKVVGYGKIIMDLLALIFSMLLFKKEHQFNRNDVLLLIFIIIAIVPILFLK